MEKKKDVETNGDIPSSSCRVLEHVSEINDDTPAFPLRVLKHVSQSNGDIPSSPLLVVNQHVQETNDDTPSSPLRVVKQHVQETNDDTPASPLRVVKHVSETNDDTPASPLLVLKHVSETNDDTPLSPLRVLKHVSESSDDTPTSPCRVLKHVSEISDTPSSPCRVLQHVSEANDDTPSSPCRVLKHVSETSDDTPASPLRHVSQTNGDTPSSPLHVLKHISETTDDTPSSPLREVVKMASKAMTGVYTGSPNMPPLGPPLHRRTKSERLSAAPTRSNSFQRLKNHIQKAWQGVGNLEENPKQRWTFNPEVLANQKRQWYEIHSKKTDLSKYTEPTSLFEHFVVVGLHSDSNLEAVEEAFAKRKTWELNGRNEKMLRHRESSIPTLEPQILFRYPPGKRLGMRPKDLPSFCFPEGVQARLMERTPSLSDLNAVVYGQEHLGRDDFSFIFSFKVADNATLFGVCLHVQEIVQRPPGVLGCASPLSPSSFCRFLVSAPRCYCLLTRVPFFELHYEMLNSIITQERLNRITQFVSEMTVPDFAPSITKTQEQMTENVGCPSRDCSADWMASAIPVDSAVALTKAAAGIISDDEVPSYSIRASEPQTPESVSANEGSEYCHAKELDSANRRNSQCSDDYASETSETRSDCFERIMGNYGNCPSSPDFFCERVGSSESLFSSVRSMGSDDEDDEIFSEYDKSTTVDVIMGWAREHNNDLLQIICGYHSLNLPPRGGEVVFQPLEHLQAINYRRLPVAALGLGNCPNIELQGSIAAEVNVRLAAAEEAVALSIWTVATVCRVLSLESVLALFSGVLLEKQVVVVCPNLGVLSAVVLSLIPMIRPFQWQSLLLPVLPRKMIDFLDAPVPFIVGVQHKPADLMLKTSNSIHVNVLKDQVKSSYMPSLPRYGELVSELRPIHARLSCQSSIAERHPVYKCNEVQAEAAWQFCNVIRQYLESLCSDLRSHTITSVQSNRDRVSLLLKDSFIDSFPGRDRPFIKQFVDTQQFSVLSDSRLASFEY